MRTIPYLSTRAGLAMLALHSLCCDAQDYALFNSGSRKLFATASGPSLGYSTTFDSTHTSGDTTSYYNFRFSNFQENAPCAYQPCHPRDLPSWLGGPVASVGPQHWIFRNGWGEAIDCDLSTSPSDTTLLLADTEQQFHLVYDGVEQTVILGQTDSVRHWKIIHRDLDGQTIASPLNGAHLSVGRTLGLVELFQVDSFPTVLRPLVLAGQTEPPLGLYRISDAAMHDHHPGDEIHWHSSSTSDWGSSSGWYSKRYIDRTDLIDSVLYTCELRSADNPNGPFTSEIITEGFSRSFILAEIPYERYETVKRSLYRAEYCGMGSWTYAFSYANDQSYSIPCDCWYSHESYNSGDAIRVMGLGTYSDHYSSAGPGGFSSEWNILYFKKDGMECGDALPTGMRTWSIPGDAVTMHPNPTYGTLTVDAGCPLTALEVLDMYGRSCMHVALGSDRAVIDLSALSNGMYAVRCTDVRGRTSVQHVLKD